MSISSSVLNLNFLRIPIKVTYVLIWSVLVCIYVDVRIIGLYKRSLYALAFIFDCLTVYYKKLNDCKCKMNEAH